MHPPQSQALAFFSMYARKRPLPLRVYSMRAPSITIAIGTREGALKIKTFWDPYMATSEGVPFGPEKVFARCHLRAQKSLNFPNLENIKDCEK